MLETFPGVPAEVVSARLTARMERQRRVLRRDDPPAVWVLVDELALYREVGSPIAMAQQMDHLLEVASLPDVTVQVVPAVAHPATVSELIVSDSAAYVEHLVGGYVYTEPETVTLLARLITTLQAEANRASESIQMFGRMRDLWAGGAARPYDGGGRPRCMARIRRQAQVIGKRDIAHRLGAGSGGGRSL